MRWRNSVRVVRGESMEKAAHGPSGSGRASAFDFTGAGGRETWIGTVRLKPSASTGPHHHGRHEAALYVVRGRSEIRWGEQLEYVADVGAGDFIYFAPYVPHQERNPSAEAADFLVVRSDNEGIAIRLDVTPVEHPERVY